MFMDAGHLCATEQNPTPEGTSMYREHMAKGMFVTHWPYGTQTEVHGLTDKAMHIYMAQAEDPLRIVRGGIFGGQLPHIECVLRAYVIAMHQVRFHSPCFLSPTSDCDALGYGGCRSIAPAHALPGYNSTFLYCFRAQTLSDGYVGTEECIWAIIHKRFPHLFDRLAHLTV